MVAVGLGNAGYERPQRRFGQPFRRPPPQDAIAQHAFAGDHQHPAQPTRRRIKNEPRQGGPRAVLAQAVQVEAVADRLAPEAEACPATAPASMVAPGGSCAVAWRRARAAGATLSGDGAAGRGGGLGALRPGSGRTVAATTAQASRSAARGFTLVSGARESADDGCGPPPALRPPRGRDRGRRGPCP